MKKTIILTITLITLTACSKESGGNEPPEVVILQPTVAVHSSTNNEPCLETNSVNDTQSSITFRWNPDKT